VFGTELAMAIAVVGIVLYIVYLGTVKTKAATGRLSGYQFNSRKEGVPRGNMQMCLTFTAVGT